MVGAGADGRQVAGMLGYGTTKCALYLTDGLAREHAGSGTSGRSVRVWCSPKRSRDLQFVPAAARGATSHT
ncbi:MAG: hypothetical protein U1F11_10255 [Steroidobacteraceae bacterium]